MSIASQRRRIPMVASVIIFISLMFALANISPSKALPWTPKVCPKTAPTSVEIPLEKGMAVGTIIYVKIVIDNQVWHGKDIDAEGYYLAKIDESTLAAGKIVFDGVIPAGKHIVEVVAKSKGYTPVYKKVTVDCTTPPVVVVPEPTPQPTPVVEPQPTLIETPAPTPTPTTTSTPIPTTTLKVVKRGPSVARTLKPVRYTITVTNRGLATAKNVVLRDIIPSGMSLIQRPKFGSLKNGVYSFDLGNIKPGKAKTVSLWLKADANTCGARTNRVVADGTNTPPSRAKRMTRIVCEEEVPVAPEVTG